jgi:hypothetical protein
MDAKEIPIDQLSFSAYRLPVYNTYCSPSAFISLAHWFEAEKFRSFHRELFDEVMLCPSVKEARKLSSANRHHWRGDWLGVRLRALACGMVYACRSDLSSTRWHGTPEQVARILVPLEFPDRFTLGAAREFDRLRVAPAIGFLGANSAPHDVVGRRVNIVHKKAERAWLLFHWQGRHGCWRVHDWAVSQHIPVIYGGSDDARINAKGIDEFRAQSQQVVVFEERGGKKMDATIRALRTAKVPIELDLYKADATSQIVALVQAQQ